MTSLIRLLRLQGHHLEFSHYFSSFRLINSALSCQSTIFAFFSYFPGSHFGHLSHFKALLWSMFGRVQTGVKIPQMVVKNKQATTTTTKKTQIVKYVLEQKYCLFFSLKRKAELFVIVWFSAMIVCSAVAVCEYLREAALLRVALLIDCMKRACVCVCVWVGWCACSDCILWPSALNK